MLEAFREGYVGVDESTREDLMAFAVEFSGLINYFNAEDRVDGDWSGFFLMDNAFLLAYISTTDIERLEQIFEKTVAETKYAVQFNIKFQLLTSIFEQILLLANLFNVFLKIVNRQFSLQNTGIKQELEQIIRGELSQELRTLIAYSEGAASRKALGTKITLPYYEFLPIWNLADITADDHIYGGQTPDRRIDCALTYLQPVWESFLYQLIFIKKFAAGLLPGALDGPHKPHIALYLAFLELFNAARKNLNTLTPRYADFYYSSILRQQKKSYTPDKVYLNLALADEEGVAGSLLKKGATFPAGADENGQDILYAADQDLWVGKAAIQQVYTIFSKHDFLINPNPDNQDCGCEPPPAPISVLSGIYAGDYMQDNVLPEQGIPTLGNDVIDAFNHYATVGFSITSEMLLLGGGERTVSFTFQLADDTVLYSYLQALQQATGKSTELLFKEVMEKSFRISLSTATGWLELNTYAVSYLSATNRNTFIISFLLPLLAPAIKPLEGAVLPVAKFECRQEPVILNAEPLIAVSPISLLSVMNVYQIMLDVDVRGFNNITLRNNISDIDTSAPFYPFSGTPVPGSYFELSGEELFGKKISYLSMEIDWYDLPKNKEGFTGYYKNYVLDADGHLLDPRIGNDTFKVKISTVNPGSWALNNIEKNLFCTSGLNGCGEPQNNESLCAATVWNKLSVESHTLPDYYSPSDSRIRIELSNPTYAFGNELYAINLMHAVIQDLPDPPACTISKELQMPSVPYIPAALSVSLDYSSSATVSFSHLLPFDGVQPVEDEELSLVPGFCEGALILGLAGLSGAQTLSLLFSMSENKGVPDFCWSYLSDDQWVFLPASGVLSDKTNHFSNTGIIRLKLPDFSAKNNTLLSADLKWIRATVKKNAADAASTFAIYPYALSATWQDNGNTATHLETPLPAFTIQSVQEDTGAIGTVNQPMASFGGRPAETYQGMMLRTGERLQHKQRAILPGDYERLVLQQFPEICRVKCLPHQSLTSSRHAGHVLVVIVQGPDNINQVKPQVPLAGEVLISAVKTYLQAFLSPFIKLEVVNPVYVKIKVRCTVQFVQDADAGTCIEMLNRDLIAWLSPWYYDSAREAKAGNYVSPADISVFIQSRPYMAFLDAMTPEYDPLPDTLETDWYFLTSAEQHEIREVNETICES
jgi:hypothetical protein